MNKFKGIYKVIDGYAGKSRPQSFIIDSDEIENDMNVYDFKNLYNYVMNEDFENNIHPSADEKNYEEFLTWAKKEQEIIRRGEDE